jgi:acyl-CoA thioesterase
MPLDPEFEAAVHERLRTSSFASWMGIRLVDVDEGESHLELDVQPHHLNPGGIVHGGIIATILDAAIGLALRTTIGTRSHVTVQLDVHYLTAANGGTLTGRGHAVHSGRRTGYGEAEVTTADGRLVAKGSASFLVMDAMPVPAGD